MRAEAPSCDKMCWTSSKRNFSTSESTSSRTSVRVAGGVSDLPGTSFRVRSRIMMPTVAGVPTMTSGGWCLSFDSMYMFGLPIAASTTTPLPFLFFLPPPVSSLKTFTVCRHSSRVGTTTTACTPRACGSSRASTGSAYASVLPEPVGQRITVARGIFFSAIAMSLAPRGGMSVASTFACTGVGSTMPARASRAAICVGTRSASKLGAARAVERLRAARRSICASSSRRAGPRGHLML